MRRAIIGVLIVGICAALAAVACADDSEDAASVKLFDGQSLKGWGFFLEDERVTMEDVWSVEEGILVCKGEPGGYLCTEKDYESFRLTLEWRWPEEPGNSGVLLRLTGEPQMLPYCAEAQLYSGKAGDIYGFQGFNVNGDRDRYFYESEIAGGWRGVRQMKSAENEPGEWNKYEIVADGGNITCLVNSELVNKVTHCDVRPGKIALQSEGGVIHFRDIELTPLAPE